MGRGEPLACAPCEFGEQCNKDALFLQMSWYINCAFMEISTVVTISLGRWGLARNCMECFSTPSS